MNNDNRETSLGAEFTAGLAAFLDGGGEVARLHGYSLGRRALEAHLGLLDLVTIFHTALSASLARCSSASEAARVARAAEGFFHECVSPYEMAFQGAGEANAALRRQNEMLEQVARRIAHEVHDSSSQLLASVHRELYQASALAPPELSARLQCIEKLLDGIESDLRRFARELRPTVLDDLGLMPALRELAASVSTRTGLRVNVHGPGDRLPPALEIALYRIVQEALANVCRHARATRADVNLVRSHGSIKCVVCDDGVGLQADVARASPGMGLVGIRERLAPLRGRLNYRNRSDGSSGVYLEAIVPLETGYVASRSG